MTDIFFSYSSVDRERVRPIRDALVAQGFEVFWDQQVPAGMDWDTWIRQHLTKSKCAMAFWSATSVSSDNVRHEATVAKQQGKLISVLLEPLTAEQFSMGLYAQQAANLSGWSGDYSHDEWRKFRREFEAKLTPLWVRRQIDELEAELVGERTRREGAERRDKVLQNQIAKEAEVQQYLKEERDIAFDEIAALKATVEELTRARSEAEAKQTETQQGLKRQLDKSLDETKMLMATIEELNRAREEAEEREAGTQQELKREHDKAFDEAAALRATVEELTRARADAEARVAELSQHLRKVRQSKAQGIARSFLGVAIPLLVLAAVVATIGFWTLGTSSRLASPRGELSVEPRFLTFAVRADRGFYKWEANKKVMLRATGGPASWEAEGSQWLAVTPSKGQLADKESLEITVSATAYPEKGKPVKGQVTFKNLDRSAKAAVVEVTGEGF